MIIDIYGNFCYIEHKEDRKLLFGSLIYVGDTTIFSNDYPIYKTEIMVREYDY